MAEVYPVGGGRTPRGKHGASPAGARLDDLAALVVRGAAARTGVPGYAVPGDALVGGAVPGGAVVGGAVDEVVLGAADWAGIDGRTIAMLVGQP